jgi:hypothetical protein
MMIINFLGIFIIFGLNDKGEAAGTHPENEAELFTLASTRLLWMPGLFLCMKQDDCKTNHSSPK